MMRTPSGDREAKTVRGSTSMGILVKHRSELRTTVRFGCFMWENILSGRSLLGGNSFSVLWEEQNEESSEEKQRRSFYWHFVDTRKQLDGFTAECLGEKTKMTPLRKPSHTQEINGKQSGASIKKPTATKRRGEQDSRSRCEVCRNESLLPINEHFYLQQFDACKVPPSSSVTYATANFMSASFSCLQFCDTSHAENCFPQSTVG